MSAPVTWDAQLPQSPLIRGYSEEDVTNSLRSNMKYPPDAVRRTSAIRVKRVSMVLFLNAVQVALLNAFYRDTALASVIYWRNHRVGGNVGAAYRFLASPVITPASGKWFYGAIAMEMVPVDAPAVLDPALPMNVIFDPETGHGIYDPVGGEYITDPGY